MTVKELIKELRKMPQDAEVYYVGDWDQLDEDDNTHTDLYKVNDVLKQTKFIDDGFDWIDVDEVLIEAVEKA